MGIIQIGNIFRGMSDSGEYNKDTDHMNGYKDPQGKTHVVKDGTALDAYWYSRSQSGDKTQQLDIDHAASARANGGEALLDVARAFTPDRIIANAYSFAADFTDTAFCKTKKVCGGGVLGDIMGAFAWLLGLVVGVAAGAVVGAFIDAGEAVVGIPTAIKDTGDMIIDISKVPCDEPKCKEDKCSAMLQPRSNAFSPVPKAPANA